MINYTVYVTHKGRIYQTNVIVDKEQPEEVINRIAKEQVIKQWTE